MKGLCHRNQSTGRTFDIRGCELRFTSQHEWMKCIFTKDALDTWGTVRDDAPPGHLHPRRNVASFDRRVHEMQVRQLVSSRGFSFISSLYTELYSFTTSSHLSLIGIHTPWQRYRASRRYWNRISEMISVSTFFRRLVQKTH